MADAPWDFVAARLADLPNTFRRSGSTFTWWEAALTTGVSRYVGSSSAQSTMTDFTQATGKWLETWGKLFGVPRYAAEGDAAYRSRITATLLAARGHPVAIDAGLTLAGLGPAYVYENLPGVTYSVQLPPPATSAERLAGVAAMLPVRPAGVPFTFRSQTGGLFLTTINHFSKSRVTGSYIVNPGVGINPILSGSTNNTAPLLPTLFLSDPTLNA